MRLPRRQTWISVCLRVAHSVPRVIPTFLGRHIAFYLDAFRPQYQVLEGSFRGLTGFGLEVPKWALVVITVLEP